MRLRSIAEKKDRCPSCGKKFPEGEPCPDVENCETCERFGPPVKESYEGLEDSDEFVDWKCSNPDCDEIYDLHLCNNCGSVWCDFCYLENLDDFGTIPVSDPNYEPGHVSLCPNCKGSLTESYEGLEDADEFDDEDIDESDLCTDCNEETVSTCDACAGPLCFDCGRWASSGHYCSGCALDEVDDSYESDDDIDEFEDDEYEGLEDADEFEDDRGYDPIWDEFTYRFLGSRSGHEFTFRGDTYRVLTGWGVDGRNVYRNDELIGQANDEVPWPEFEYNAVGEHIPAERWTWYELVEQLYNMYGPEDYGDPPPGVGV